MLLASTDQLNSDSDWKSKSHQSQRFDIAQKLGSSQPFTTLLGVMRVPGAVLQSSPRCSECLGVGRRGGKIGKRNRKLREGREQGREEGESTAGKDTA